MQQRRIGDLTVSAVGLGAMPLSTKEDRPSPAEAEAVVHAALDAGVTLIDTADAYARDEAEFGHNEELVARALASYGATRDVLVATKGGHTRRAPTGGWTGRRPTCAGPARPRCAGWASRRSGCTSSTGRTRPRRGRSRWARCAPGDDGLVQMVGISNADVDQIDAARAIVGDALVSVQNQFSPGCRSSAGELAHCAAVGLAFLPWSPFGGVRRRSRWARGRGFAAVADELGVSVYRVTLAWHLAQADVVLPIPGASRPASILDSAAAADLTLPPSSSPA